MLLDVNNLYVSGTNLDYDPLRVLDTLPLDAVGEIHLAGHAVDGATGLLIDDHGSPVGDAVWALYTEVIARCGARPTLIEWDNRDAGLGAHEGGSRARGRHHRQSSVRRSRRRA